MWATVETLKIARDEGSFVVVNLVPPLSRLTECIGADRASTGTPIATTWIGNRINSQAQVPADSPLEGDGFEPSVPHKKTTLFGCPRSVPQFAFRKKNRLFRSGTDGSNPSPSCGESPANLSFRRIEVQGRSREAAGDSRGGEHQGCAAVQQLTASPAADATESNVELGEARTFVRVRRRRAQGGFRRHGECLIGRSGNAAHAASAR